MRVTAAILFICGIPWALIAWIAILGGPAAVFEELAAGRMEDVIVLLLFWPLFAAHVALGYVIWARWLLITRDRSSSSRRFWLIAAGHQLLWIAFGSYYYFQSEAMNWPVLLGYATVVFFVCIATALAATNQTKRSHGTPTTMQLRSRR